jgi:hypothetical protein
MNDSNKDYGRNIEVLLSKASVDPRFRAHLLRRRGRAPKKIGLELTQEEIQMLDSMSAAHLFAIIKHVIVPPHLQAAFLGTDSAAMREALAVERLMNRMLGGIRP